MKITPYLNNAKKHDKKQVEQIADSIKEFGMNQQIVVDNQGVIIVGHGRYLALQKLGMEVKKEWIKVVDMTEEQASAYRFADNKLNESPWDMDLAITDLKLLSSKMFDLTGFDKDLLIEDDEADDVIPENVPSRTKLGDLYELGQHRVLCADSTQQEAVLRLCGENRAQMCFTDPPYNVDYQGGVGAHEQNKREGIKNDKMSKGSFKQFMVDAMKPIIANNCQYRWRDLCLYGFKRARLPKECI